MAKPEYGVEHLNYFRICFVATDIIPEGLRKIFQQEWDHRYSATLGEWKDTAQNGKDFYNNESPSNKRRNARLLTTMVKGNRSEWDCTMLFYAILYSDCIHRLNPTIQASVDDLRKLRNEDFAHISQGKLTDPDFQIAINKVDAAFQALGLPTAQIQEISKQKSFPTDELKNITNKVAKLDNEVTKLDNEKQVLEAQLQREISSFCVLPSAPSHNVTYRHKEVSESMQKLHQMQEDNDVSLSTMYLSGNPGSGKSQFARQIGEKWFESATIDESAAVFTMTLNAESSDALLDSYVKFARKVKCSEYVVTNTISSKSMKTEDKICRLKGFVTTKLHLYTTWLLIVDNVIDLSLLHLPHPGSEEWKGGQLLITTQDTSSIPSSSSFVTHVSMSRGMELTDATSLLFSISGVSDKEMEKVVAKELDYQPLALASAATYVKQLRECRTAPNFEWNGYLKKLKEGRRRLTEDHLAKTNPSYPTSMTVALTMAVQRTAEADEDMKQAFHLLSLCSSEPLRLEIITTYISDNNNNRENDEIAIKLRKCPLLLFDSHEDCTCISLHRAVHDVIRCAYSSHACVDREEQAYKTVLSFGKFLNDIFPENWEFLDFCTGNKFLIPHLNSLAAELNQAFSTSSSFLSEGEQVSKLFNSIRKFIKICRDHCCYQTALEFLILINNNSRCLDNVENAQLLNDFGEINCDLGNFYKAKDFLQRALAIRLNERGPEHLDVAITCDSLGYVCYKLGDLQQAKQHYESSLTIGLKQLDREHVGIARFYSNLGSVYDGWQAKQHFEHALAIYLKQVVPEHVDVAQTYNNLGLTYHDLGDLEKAKQHLERALAIELKQLGPEHVDVARTFNDLGLVYRKLDDLQQAKQHIQHALAIYLKQLGPKHVNVAHTYNNLGQVYAELGDLEQAKQHCERALAIYLKQVGTEHVYVAHSCNNLGLVRRDLGDLEQAKQHLERALAVELKQLGPEHVDVANTFYNLGLVYRDLGDPEQAKRHLERALAIYLKQVGPEDVYVAHTYNNLGLVRRDLGNLEQAKQHLERALAIELKELGPEHVEIATTFSNLGLVYSDLGDLDQAKQHLERALAIYLKILGPEHVDVETTCNTLHKVYRELNNLQQRQSP